MQRHSVKAGAAGTFDIWLPSIVSLIVLTLAPLVAGDALEGTRRPLQKSGIEIRTPGPVPKEVIGYRDGQPVYYDPRPQIDPLGDGTYAFRWIGLRGQPLTVIYQRPDMVDVVVEAAVSTAPSGLFRYRYTVRNLRSSKQNLAGFAVQTFSPGAEAEKQPGVGVADMTNSVNEFKDGRWIFFSFLGDQKGYQKAVQVGQEVVVRVISSDPPGIVQCRAYGGSQGLKGVGEEMPPALENVIPGYDIWPHGLSVGPDSRQLKLSPREKITSLVQHLPEMLRLGWLRDSATMDWYRENLTAGKIAQVKARAKRDSEKDIATSEMLALLSF